VSPRARAAAVLVAAALVVAGCGEEEEEEGIGEDSLRRCLADAGLSQKPEGATPNAPLFNLPTDFRLGVPGGGSAGFVVEGSEEKIRRRAADIRAALRTFGVADPDRRLVARGNVIAVFDRAPKAAARHTVDSCLR
jgi:hypothetical protein